ELRPAGEAVAPGQLPPRLGAADPGGGLDAVRPPFVVPQVGVERLLVVETLGVGLQLRPAGEPVLAREHQLRARQPDGQVAEPAQGLRVPGPGAADELPRLLAELL